jgi:GTPase SAR1 family protein
MIAGEIEGELYGFQFWDTTGQDEYQATTSLYLQNAKAAGLVFDLSDRMSFDALQGWITLLNPPGCGDEAAIVLMATKVTFQQQIEKCQLRTSLASAMPMKAFLTLRRQLSPG